jgi:hypothetical protein
MDEPIFVFGSNLAGRHGAGAALFAKQKKGAVYGCGVGLQGNSYAIPTKDERINTLPLVRIKPYIDQFLEYAKNHPEMVFELTPIGCGYAGYSAKDIAPMFEYSPANVTLPISFIEFLRTKGAENETSSQS